MRIQYVLTEKEVEEGNREFYLRAKGFEDALTILGILEDKR